MRVGKDAPMVEILLIEDIPGDVRLTREALKGGRVLNNLHVVEDGQQAIAFYAVGRDMRTHLLPNRSSWTCICRGRTGKR
jgi:CheY-like chemotaxis protein